MVHHTRTTLSVENANQTNTILVSVIISLTLSPITFHWTSCLNATSKQSDLIACLLTLILSGVLALIINNILNRRCQQFTVNLERPPLLKKTLLRVFSSSKTPISPLKSSVYHGSVVHDSPQDKHSRSNIRIDPKYFKPKYIMHEVMSMWGLTYTVVTWGSVWVIGGTIVASEKLAHKIKTKYSREPQQQRPNHQQQQQQQSTDGNRFWNERNNSYTSLLSADSLTSLDESTNKSSFKRLRTWTRRSYASAKKRFNKFVHGSTVPQLTGASNESATSR